MENKLYIPDFLKGDDELMSAAEARRRMYENRDKDEKIKEELKQCQQQINEACEKGKGFVTVRSDSLGSEAKSRLKEEGYELTPCGALTYIHWSIEE